MAKIYVQLFEEGTPTIRPTEAIDLGDGTYRLLPTPNYDPEDETWEFLPGTVVKGKIVENFGEQILYATEKVG